MTLYWKYLQALKESIKPVVHWVNTDNPESTLGLFQTQLCSAQKLISNFLGDSLRQLNESLNGSHMQWGEEHMIFTDYEKQVSVAVEADWCNRKAFNGNFYISVINLDQRCHHPVNGRENKNPRGHRSLKWQIRSKYEMGLVLLCAAFLELIVPCHRHSMGEVHPCQRAYKLSGASLAFFIVRASPSAQILAPVGPRD